VEATFDRNDIAVGVGLPNCREGRLHPIGVITPEWMRAIAQLAETLEYDSLWLNEFSDTEPSVRATFAQGPRYYDPLMVIADLAARTEVIRFLTATLVLPEHSPLVLARQLASLNSLSGGRLAVGVGLGGPKDEFRRLHGELGTPNRGEMMDDFLGALHAYRTEPLAGYSGKYVAFDAIHTGSLPGDDYLPVLAAGSSASVVDRIARYADGWIDSHLSPDDIHTTLTSLSEGFVARNRAARPVVLRQFNMSLASSLAEAEARVDAVLGDGASKQPPAGVDRRLIGTPESVTARLNEYLNAGVREICAIFFGTDIESVAGQMHLFTDQVRPNLRAGHSSVALNAQEGL
jgi:alkanesulfonate monooxygenase SsuD/methylene tetrahydromethanopterin reductase-like flavin-dependent oxidoreductase (luciferase family)